MVIPRDSFSLYRQRGQGNISCHKYVPRARQNPSDIDALEDVATEMYNTTLWQHLTNGKFAWSEMCHPNFYYDSPWRHGFQHGNNTPINMPPCNLPNGNSIDGSWFWHITAYLGRDQYEYATVSMHSLGVYFNNIYIVPNECSDYIS